MFRTLRNHDGTPLVALDRDELQMDGVLDGQGAVPDDQPMHIQRVGKACYLVRAVNEDGLPDLDEVFRL
ncbi:hypothetical protein [Natronocalculus amylovorans]|uniref:DUF8053 domain-containing protein n=1 Tax=Natronocalculus amylovorans TaxID=2917812 RepID=A0AAE3FWS5_9EURY|nr:hypothetical protein [Natronocalculus amylovorans]MCL9817022.1 hypothetical protein [Natronocalculus amylovorans]